MIAYLGFYDMAPVQSANDRLWSEIRRELGHGPETLSRPDDLWPVWRAPDLLLAQTCSLPYRRDLHEHVTLVGTPDYGLADCPPGHYRSAMVVRKGETPREGLRLAINDPHSQSGWVAPHGWLIARDMAPSEIIATGGHAISVHALADGRADIAGIDLLSWTMLNELNLLPSGLEIVDLTPPTLGTPYVTARANDPVPIADAITRAIAALPADVSRRLHLRGLVQHGTAAYMAEPIPAPPIATAA